MSTETPIDDEDPSIVLGRGIDALRLRAETAERELAAANAALAAARVNEARYLWIRASFNGFDPSDDPESAWAKAWEYIELGGIKDNVSPEELDALIDRARSVPQGAK